MRVDLSSGDAGFLKLTMSRRNLLVLLSKLDMRAEGQFDSACSIETHNFYVDGVELTITELTLHVHAEEDDMHYLGREPGPMHPITEADL